MQKNTTTSGLEKQKSVNIISQSTVPLGPTGAELLEHTSRAQPALPGAATAAAASATPGTTPAALTGKSKKRVTN